MSTIKQQRRTVILCLLLPGLTYLIAIRIVPVFYTLYLSFTEWDLTEQAHPTFVGLRNYINIFHDELFVASIGRTIFYAITVTAIELVLGVLIALFVYRDFRGRNPTRASLLTPMILTPSVVGMIWYVLYHNSIGPLNWLLGLIGISPVAWLTDPTIALFSLMLTDIWHWTPFMFLLSYSAMQMIPVELYESAEVDGANSWQMTTLITLPMIRETVIVALVLRSMEAFEIFAEPFVMTGGGPGEATETISIHIYKAAFLLFKMGYAGAMVMVSIMILMGVYWIYFRIAKFD